MRKVSTVLTTDGKGYWSDVAKDVTITGLNLSYINDEGDFGELRVFFDTNTWNCNNDGLIYTDNKFMSMLQAFLCEKGFNGNDVDYSEQGMQGGNFVSCDVGKDFIDSFTVQTV